MEMSTGSMHPYLKGFENVDIARSFMWVDSSAPDEDEQTTSMEVPETQSGQESLVGTPVDEFLAKIQHNAAWLGGFVSQLSTWLATNATATQISDELPAPLAEEEAHGEIWQEWEWIMSETEKFALRKTTEDSDLIKKELEGLRNTANVLKARPIFLQHAKTLLQTALAAEDVHKLATRILDSSKRSKVITDVVAAYATEWLEFIKEQLLKDEDSSIIATYHDSYIETPYSKGVVGGMKETGWQASHGPGDSGLTHCVLGDITWAFWKTVNSSLRWSLDRELTPEESNALVERMAVCQAKLVDLWLTTVNNSETGTANEGKLPAIWAQEAKEKQAKLNEIKRLGASARYEYTPVTTVSTQLNRQKLGELRKFLEGRLQFRTN